MIELDDQGASLYEGKWKWLLMLGILCVLGLLWITWRTGTYPFGAPSTIIAPVTTTSTQTQKDVLSSLTLPKSATTSPSAVVTSNPVLKSLTPPAKNKTIKTSTSVLDSLTPPKQ